MRKYVKGGLLLLVIFLGLFITGCWDYRPMAKRAYVIAIAIDQFKASESKGLDRSLQESRPKFAVTFQLPNFAQGGSGEGGGGGGDKHILFDVGASTMFEAFRRLALSAPWEPFFEHLAVIVISEEVLKGDVNLAEILDSFERQQQMRRDIRIFITPQQAREVIMTDMPGPQPIAFVMEGLFKEQSLGYSPSQSSLGSTAAVLHEEGDTFLPVIQTTGKMLAAGGAAVFKNGRFVGKLTEEEVRATRILRDSLKSTVYDVPCSTDGTKRIVFEAESIKTKLKIEGSSGEDLRLSIYTELEGNISENQCRQPAALSRDTFRYVENEVARMVQRDIDKILAKMRELDIDLIGLHKKTRQQNPALARTLEADNRQFTVHAPAKVNVKVGIKATGLLND